MMRYYNSYPILMAMIRGNGNARIAIETLSLAGEIAEKEGSPVVLLDHAKKANST